MNKYRNVRMAVDNITFDSKREATRYAELKMLLRANAITDLECHKIFPIVVNGVSICKYICDFSYRDSQGQHIVEDTKGVPTSVYRLKAKLILRNRSYRANYQCAWRSCRFDGE